MLKGWLIGFPQAQRVKCIIEAAGLTAQNENALDPKLPHYQEAHRVPRAEGLQVIKVLAEVKEVRRFQRLSAPFPFNLIQFNSI